MVSISAVPEVSAEWLKQRKNKTHYLCSKHWGSVWYSQQKHTSENKHNASCKARIREEKFKVKHKADSSQHKNARRQEQKG